MTIGNRKKIVDLGSENERALNRRLLHDVGRMSATVTRQSALGHSRHGKGKVRYTEELLPLKPEPSLEEKALKLKVWAVKARNKKQ